MKKKLYLGIDIGGSSIKFGWGNCKQGLLKLCRYELKDNTIDSLQHQIEMMLLTVDKSVGLSTIEAIGMGTPGTIDVQTGKIVGVNPNLPQWTDIDPKSLLQGFFTQDICVDNDANLMTLGEAIQFPDNSYIAGITIGSGIGCGFVKDMQIYHGAHGFAMELGHVIVKANGIQCNCGRLGCLEAYSSVNGLINQIKSNNPELDLKTMSDIIQIADSDEASKQLLLDSIRYLSVSISNLVVLLDVDAVIIGGGAAEEEGYPYPLLYTTTLNLLPEQFRHKTLMRRAILGNQAGVMGAIIMAERR